MKKNIMLPLIGCLFIIVGLFGIGIQLRNQRTTLVATPPANLQQSAAIVKPNVATPGFVDGNPVRIQIPSVGIDVSITPGYYDVKTGQWTLTLHQAQYATMTPAPNNQTGNTFIYGHARSEVFGSLHKLHKGAQAIIATNNNHTFYYDLQAVSVVNPTNSAAVLAPTSTPTLTLQTCTGLLWQNRQLFSFNLERVV